MYLYSITYSAIGAVLGSENKMVNNMLPDLLRNNWGGSASKELLTTVIRAIKKDSLVPNAACGSNPSLLQQD